jgi:N-acetylmuramic acid 6-phosphate etherase
MKSKLFEELKNLTTESINPVSKKIDRVEVSEILKIINREDQKAAKAVRKEIKNISKAVSLIVNVIKNGGRLFYIGAGTSGRLGILDAVECPPTFGVSSKLIQGIIAGGNKALIKSQEGIEDKKSQAKIDLKRRNFNKKDVLCGIAASSRTPYVISALEYAKKIGAKTIYISCNPKSQIQNRKSKIQNQYADVEIRPVVGPEVIAGSTRMKAGTSQKMILNMITTATMIKLGKVYGNLMVDLKIMSKKLEERAKKIIMLTTNSSYKKAEILLKKASNNVKLAIIMGLTGVDVKIARKFLNKNGGIVAKAIEELSNG